MPLEAGIPAPDFALPDENGKVHRLSDYRGNVVVLYFYPKDNTPGCTREAVGFRDDFDAFQQAGVVILGVSPDPPERHARFKAKYNLPFTLLADPEHKVCELYDVWKKKKNFGKEYFGVARTTYIIAPDGTIAKVYKRVKTAEHSQRVLEDLQALGMIKAQDTAEG